MKREKRIPMTGSGPRRTEGPIRGDKLMLAPFACGAGSILDLFGRGMRSSKLGSLAQDRAALAGDLRSIGNDFKLVLFKRVSR